LEWKGKCLAISDNFERVGGGLGVIGGLGPKATFPLTQRI